MQIDSQRRLARLSLAQWGDWLGVFVATTANAQTFRLVVNADYAIAADRSFVLRR
jgi:hypothetical protein